MMGTSFSATLVMLWMPPMMTRATMTARSPATNSGLSFGMAVVTLATMALAWTVQPMPKEASRARMAKMMPSHFMWSRRSRAYMAPPIISPFSPLTRYLTAMMVSEYLVAMPRRPVIHIQRTAPGPPRAMAVPTPTMLPVPMVEDRAVVSAPNWLTLPVASGSGVTDSLMALKTSFWMKPVRMVMKMCVPNRMMMRGQPHRKSETAVTALTIIICRLPLRFSFSKQKRCIKFTIHDCFKVVLFLIIKSKLAVYRLSW